MKNAFLFFLVYVSLSTEAYSTGKPASPKVSLGGYGFIENKGQIIDQNNKPNKEVLYLYNGNGLQVQLRQNGFSYEVIKTEKTLKAIGVKSKDQNYIPNKFEPDSFDYTYKIHRIDILFEGINKNIQITTFEPSSDYINYYTGSPVRAPLVGALPPAHNPQQKNTGITNIHHYQKILYQNIYSNIDVEFILNNENPSQKFKYNFIIHPGGNINDIKLKFLGATNTSLTEDGHITIETAYGNIDESIPLSYQENENGLQKQVETKFTLLSKNKFGIRAETFDPTRTLTIDPVPWATYFGGAGNEHGYAIAVDGNDNILVTGSTSSTSAIATTGAYQTSFAGTTDAYVLKLNPSGIPIWATYFGAGGWEDGRGIATDVNGNIFVTGRTHSTSGIATTGAHQTTSGGDYDGLIFKLNSSGILQWATYFGGNNLDEGYAICTDAGGNIYVSGRTASSNNIATTGAYQTAMIGYNDAFIVKFNPAGVIQWATYFGGNGSDESYGICLDLTGNIYIGGTTNSNSGISTTGAFQTAFGGGQDGFIAKFNATGTLSWSTYYGGSDMDYLNGIVCDGSNNLLIVGFTNSTSGIATLGSYQAAKSGNNWDAYIVKLDPSGNRIWATYYGGTNGEYSAGIDVDAGNNIYITSWTLSTNGIATAGAYQTTIGGGVDAFILELSSSGTPLWASYFGGLSEDDGNAIAVNSTGTAYITGRTQSMANIATAGAYQTTFGGQNEAFIVAFQNSIAQPLSNNTVSADQNICIGSTPLIFTGSSPSGGNGLFSYSWLSSTTSSTSGFILASGTNNTINYSPPALSINTWYKRVVSSGTYFDTSNVIAITVGSKLNVGFTVNQMIQCIKTNNFIFTDTTTATGTITRLWDFGNGTTSTLINPNISYNFNIANAYWVKLKSSVNGACHDSARQRVFVISNPAPTGSISGNTVINRLSTHTYSVPASMGSSYQWIFTHGIGSSSSNSINIKWNELGTVDLRVLEFSGGGCAGDTVYQSITINPGVGLEGFERNDAITIYPNPSNGIVHISRANPYSSLYQNSSLQITIYDMQGKQIYQNFWPENTNKIELDLTVFNAGIYSLQLVEPDGNTYMKKLQLMK